MSESPRQQTHWPWMRELHDAGLDDVALAVDQQREVAQRPAIYASPSPSSGGHRLQPAAKSRR